MKLLSNCVKEESNTKRDGALIGIVGAQGSGKSLTMTYLGLSRLAYFNDKLYSNYKLFGNFQYYYFDTKKDIFEEIKQINNSTIMLDEFHTYIDSYDWRDPVVSDFIKQKMVSARRKGNYFIMGNQLRSQFPKRLRIIMPIWILPYIKKRKYKNGKMIPYIVEYTEINKNTAKIRKEKFYCGKIMQMYDTYENFDHLLMETTQERKNRMSELRENILEEEMDGII